MRATIEACGEEATKPLGLEAEAAAWRSKRGSRPTSVTGKVPVVHIRRRLRPSLSSGSSAGRPLAVERR